MASLSDLQNRVATTLEDTSTEVLALITPWIEEAQREAEKRHTFLWQEKSTSYVTAEDTRLLGAKPADWLQSRDRPYMEDGVGDTREVRWIVDSQDIVRTMSNNPIQKGAPQFIQEMATTFNVYPYPDALAPPTGGNYTIHFPYRAREVTLVNPGDTNGYTDNLSDYLSAYALAQAFNFVRDRDEALIWQAKANEYLRSSLTFDKRSRVTRGLDLKPRFDTYGSAFWKSRY